MINTKIKWEESQGYLAFVASGYYFSNKEDRTFVTSLIKKNDQGKTWSNEELERLKVLLGKRSVQIDRFEQGSRESEAKRSQASYFEFDDTL